MFEEMIATAEDFYQSLGIPYHIVNIVSGRGWGILTAWHRGHHSAPWWPRGTPAPSASASAVTLALTHFPARFSLSLAQLPAVSVPGEEEEEETPRGGEEGDSCFCAEIPCPGHTRLHTVPSLSPLSLPAGQLECPNSSWKLSQKNYPG